MSIFHFPAEVRSICLFLRADEQVVNDWLKKNDKTDKYIKFEAITNLGQTWVQVIYGKNLSSKTEVVCHVSYLGTQFQDSSINGDSRG